MKKKIGWIENLKYIAALSVFWGHFYLAFYGARADSGTLKGVSKYLIFCCNHIVRILVDGTFWVYVFCLLGGLFASKKVIMSLKELVETVIYRYIRFFIPVIFSNLFAFGIQKSVGYHAHAFGLLTNNARVSEAYQTEYTIIDVLRSALFLTHEFNGSFWVIRPIFFGSCILYLYVFIKGKTKKDSYLLEVVLLIMFWITLFVAPVHDKMFYAIYFAVGGMILNCIWDNVLIPDDILWLPETMLLLIILSLNVNPNMDMNVKSFLAFFFLLSIHYVPKAKDLLGCRWFSKHSYLSFGIFAVHGPLLFSVSILMQERLMESIPYSASVVINLVFSTVMIIFVAYVYHKVVEKFLELVLVNFRKAFLS